MPTDSCQLIQVPGYPTSLLSTKSSPRAFRDRMISENSSRRKHPKKISGASAPQPGRAGHSFLPRSRENSTCFALTARMVQSIETMTVLTAYLVELHLFRPHGQGQPESVKELSLHKHFLEMGFYHWISPYFCISR